MTLNKEDRDMEIPRVRPLHLRPPTDATSLVFSHVQKYKNQTFCTLDDGCNHVTSVPEMPRMSCVASCFGWLIMQNRYSDGCYLFDPILLTKIHLPPLMHNNLYVGTLTHPPSDPNCVAVLFNSARQLCMYCRIGDTRWTEKKMEYYDKKDKGIHRMNFVFDHVNVISCNGKVYLFFYEGMAVVDVHDSIPVKIDLCKSRKYTLYECYQHTNFHVESGGEIYLACAVHLGFCMKIFETVNVFKLDLCRKALVKVESLGDRIFLLSKTSSASVSATELGIKGNCIFFYLSDQKLYRYDMDNGTITITLACPNMPNHHDSPFWMVPNYKPHVRKGEEEVCEQNGNAEDSYMKQLPTEILETISSYLFLDDCTRWRLVCKAWMSMTQPVRPYTLLLESKTKHKSQQIPWLFAIPKNKNCVCNLYHPLYSDAYTMNIPEVAGAVVRHANYGWLLMSQGGMSFFFFNPITKELIKLPPLDPYEHKRYRFISISFSCPPTSSDCMVLGLMDSNYHRIDINMCLYAKRHDHWIGFSIASRPPNGFVASHCNPIFCDGVFYCLGKDGQLGLFNMEEEHYCNVWKILPVPAVISFEKDYIYSSSLRSFILEYEGDIISVFIGEVGLVGKPVWVFKLDRNNEEWKWARLDTLGDKVVFLSHTTSMILSASGMKGIENRIYLPKVYGKESIYYSLATGSYHCFGSKDSPVGWTTISEYWNCTWIQFMEHSNASAVSTAISPSTIN